MRVVTRLKPCLLRPNLARHRLLQVLTPDAARAIGVEMAILLDERLYLVPSRNVKLDEHADDKLELCESLIVSDDVGSQLIGISQ